MKDWLSSWHAIKTYIDIETGEIITEKEYKTNYTLLKTIKNAERSKYGTGGIVKYTKICERNRQRRLF